MKADAKTLGKAYPLLQDVHSSSFVQWAVSFMVVF